MQSSCYQIQGQFHTALSHRWRATVRYIKAMEAQKIKYAELREHKLLGKWSEVEACLTQISENGGLYGRSWFYTFVSRTLLTFYRKSFARLASSSPFAVSASNWNETETRESGPRRIALKFQHTLKAQVYIGIRIISNNPTFQWFIPSSGQPINPKGIGRFKFTLAENLCRKISAIYPVDHWSNLN